jgi:hypothetical protein
MMLLFSGQNIESAHIDVVWNTSHINGVYLNVVCYNWISNYEMSLETGAEWKRMALWDGWVSGCLNCIHKMSLQNVAELKRRALWDEWRVTWNTLTRCRWRTLQNGSAGHCGMRGGLLELHSQDVVGERCRMEAYGIVGWEEGYLNYTHKMSLENVAEWKRRALWDERRVTWTTLIRFR